MPKWATELSNIPTELRTPQKWMRYYGDKHPCEKYATVEDKLANFRSLDHLIENRPATAGIQRWADLAEGLIYIDFDHVRNEDTGEVKPWAEEWVDKLDTYTEVSASGTGLHLVCRGRLGEDLEPPTKDKRGDDGWVEIYSGHKKNKLIAFTGNIHGFHFQVEERQTQVEELLREGKAARGEVAKPSVELVTGKEPAAEADLDMPDSCLDGWLGEVCKERFADFPRSYSWIAVVVAASVLARSNSPLNLYGGLVGKIHSGKSQVEARVFYQLGLQKPVLQKLKSGSPEGLAQHIGDVAGAPRLVAPDELGHLLVKAGIEGSTFAKFLTTAFYETEQELTVSKRKHIVFNACLSVLGGVVLEEFETLFGSNSTGGLYDRFIFGICPASFKYLYRPIEGEPAFTPPPVEDEGTRVVPGRPSVVALRSSVFDERDKWVKDLGIGERVAELAIRVATICASMDARRELTAADLGPALEFAKYQTKVRELLQPNPGENDDAKMGHAIRNWLAKNARGGKWISRRDLFRAINAHRLGGAVFDRALRAMEFNGELEKREALVRLKP